MTRYQCWRWSLNGKIRNSMFLPLLKKAPIGKGGYRRCVLPRDEIYFHVKA